MARKKILLIGFVPPPYNGMSVVMNNLLNSSLVSEFDISYVDIADRRTISNMGSFDLTNIFLAFRHAFQFMYKLMVERPDIVYLPIAQNTAGYLRDSLFLIPARLAGVKTVVHLHGSCFREFFDKAPLWLRSLIRFSLRDVAACLVLGERLKGIFSGLVRPERVIAVSNGIEDRFPGYRREYCATDGFRVLMLTNLCRAKGVFEVLKAVKGVAGSVRGVKFVFAGEWYNEKEKREALNLIREQGIADHVEFPGVVSGTAKEECLKTANLFILISAAYPYDGQPLAILEAMSAGLPVIAADKGAIADMVKDGENGYLVPIGDEAVLRSKILRFAGDPRLCESFGKKSRQLFVEKFEKDAFIRTMSSVFDRIS